MKKREIKTHFLKFKLLGNSITQHTKSFEKNFENDDSVY